MAHVEGSGTAEVKSAVILRVDVMPPLPRARVRVCPRSVAEGSIRTRSQDEIKAGNRQAVAEIKRPEDRRIPNRRGAL